MNAVRRNDHPTLILIAGILLGLLRAAPVAAQGEVHDLYLQAREHLIEEELPEALTLFRRIVSSSPEADEADDAQYYVGYVLERMGRGQEAAAAFDELLRRWPDSVRADNARTRLAVLRGQDRDPGVRGSLDIVLRSDAPWDVKRETAMALARAGDLSGMEVLQQVMERESSSRQIELVRILADHATDPAALRILETALQGSTSTSVKLEALRALERYADRPEVALLAAGVLDRSESSSVQQKAVQILTPHVRVPAARSALAKALGNQNSTSVQILACQGLAGHMLDPEVRPAILAVLRPGTSTSVQLKALDGLEASRNDPAVAEFLRAATAEQNASSVQLKAMKIAGSSSQASVRAASRAALVPGVSSSVQMEAVQALDSGPADPAAAEALRDLLQARGISTSVQMEALKVLPRHMETPAGPQALAASMDPSNSTSVLLLAVRLAAGRTGQVQIREALLRLLGTPGTSTSVQLEAIGALTPLAGDAVVRGVVAAALRRDNSTSVQLKAIDALGPHAKTPEARSAMIGVLQPGYSTSVVLASLEALASQVRSSSEVRTAFLGLMEEADISSSARIRAAGELLEGASSSERSRIVEAMEDVIIRISRQRWGTWTRDAIDDALDVVKKVDPARAEALRERYGKPPTLLERLLPPGPSLKG